MEKQYIIWDPTDGELPYGDDGKINTGGVLGGKCTKGNAYIRIYPRVLGEKTVSNLEIGEYVPALYNLSRAKPKLSHIYRVE